MSAMTAPTYGLPSEDLRLACAPYPKELKRSHPIAPSPPPPRSRADKTYEDIYESHMAWQRKQWEYERAAHFEKRLAAWKAGTPV